MKERPILFSGPMVRALLSGKKTQTRRIVKPQPHAGVNDCEPHGVTWRWAMAGSHGRSDYPHGELGFFPCPYGQPGDRLWVKETFHYDNVDYVSKYKSEPWLGLPDAGNAETYYRASEKAPEIFPRWRPSIFMPRWASRIQLEITAVRVERLNEISLTDAEAEGLAKLTKDSGRTWKYGIPDRDGLPGNDDDGWHWSRWRQSPVDAYEALWESINGAGSWAQNPWVWVVEFKKIT